MNAAIYARVSTDWQAEHGYSIQTQLEECRAKAESVGASVVKEYVDDGYSGGFLERPALDALRDALPSGIFDVVIFHDPDRLARKLIHQLILTEEMERAHVRPLFVLENYEQSPEGLMSYQMKGVFAEYERAKIRERTMRGKRAKLRAGLPVCDSHIFGYDFDKDAGRYVINKGEAEAIRTIYRLYADEQIGGVDRVIAELEKLHVPPPNGRQRWPHSSVHKILRHEHYTGHYFANTVYHKKVGPNKWTRIPRPESEWIEMSCPPIISQELFDKAQAIRNANRTYKFWARYTSEMLLLGLAKCKECGSQMYSAHGKKPGQVYYSCSRLNNPDCPNRFAEKSIADDLFWQMLVELCKNPFTLASYIREHQRQSQAAAHDEDRAQKLRDRLQRIRNEKAALLSWFSDGLIEQQEVTEKLAALKNEAAGISSKLAAGMETAHEPVMENTPQEIAAAVLGCPESYEARRRVLLAIVSRVEMARVDNNRGRGYEMEFEVYFK